MKKLTVDEIIALKDPDFLLYLELQTDWQEYPEEDLLRISDEVSRRSRLVFDALPRGSI